MSNSSQFGLLFIAIIALLIVGAWVDSPPPEPVSEAELQRRYQALRADRIERNRVGAKRSLVISTFTLLIAIALFVLHWRWLRDRPRTAPAVPPAA